MAASAHSTLSPLHQHTTAYALILLHGSAQCAELAYIGIILCCFPLLYSTHLERIFSIAGNSPPLSTSTAQNKWRVVLADVVSLSRPTSGLGFFCICLGGYIAQNSYETRVAVLGEVLMLLGIDAVVNAFTVFLYIKLVAEHTQLNNLSIDRESFVRRTVMVLAVPASSIIWCILVAFAAVVFYFGQPATPQIDLESYFDRADTTKHHHTPSSHSPTPSSPSPLFVAAHTFPFGARLCVGVVAAVCAMHSLFVLYSVLHLRNFDKYPLGSQDVELGSTTSDSAPISPSDAESWEEEDGA